MDAKEKAIKRLKTALAHKREWKREMEDEFAAKGENVNIVFL